MGLKSLEEQRNELGQCARCGIPLQENQRRNVSWGEGIRLAVCAPCADHILRRRRVWKWIYVVVALLGVIAVLWPELIEKLIG